MTTHDNDAPLRLHLGRPDLATQPPRREVQRSLGAAAMVQPIATAGPRQGIAVAPPANAQHAASRRRRADARRQPWRHLATEPWPLLGILAAQVLLSARLFWTNTAYQDEALYLWSGHLEWLHWLHGLRLPASFPEYFSGAPVIYPPLGAIADSLGGLAAARSAVADAASSPCCSTPWWYGHPAATWQRHGRARGALLASGTNYLHGIAFTTFARQTGTVPAPGILSAASGSARWPCWRSLARRR